MGPVLLALLGGLLVLTGYEKCEYQNCNDSSYAQPKHYAAQHDSAIVPSGRSRMVSSIKGPATLSDLYSSTKGSDQIDVKISFKEQLPPWAFNLNLTAHEANG